VRLVEGGPELVLFYEPLPTIASAPSAAVRAQRWRALWETLPETPTGRYRLIASGRALVGGEESTYRVESSVFTVGTTDAYGAAATASLSVGGELRLVVRLPPNPAVRDAMGTVVRNFRLRDEGARASEGARARGGAVTGTLTQPDGTTRQAALAWDDGRGAYVASGITRQSGSYRLVVAPGALQDGAGNTNRAEFTVSLAVQ
jgi:hypothetical protein